MDDGRRADDQLPCVLSEDALRGGGDNETFDAGLSKAEASKRIDQMRKRVGRG